MEAQVSLTVAFSSSALLGLVSLIFLLTIPHRLSMAGVPNLFYSGAHLLLRSILQGPPMSDISLYCRPTSAAKKKVFNCKLFLLTKTFVLPYTACYIYKKTSNFKQALN